MRKPAKAAPRRTGGQRRDRPIDPALRPSESALGYLDANNSHSLSPVIAITGISDPNEINDLAISTTFATTETLHIVFESPDLCVPDPPRTQRNSRELKGIFREFRGIFWALTGRAVQSRFPSLPPVQIAIRRVRNILYNFNEY
jgi:hypothetical protein